GESNESFVPRFFEAACEPAAAEKGVLTKGGGAAKWKGRVAPAKSFHAHRTSDGEMWSKWDAMRFAAAASACQPQPERKEKSTVIGSELMKSWTNRWP